MNSNYGSTSIQNRRRLLIQEMRLCSNGYTSFRLLSLNIFGMVSIWSVSNLKIFFLFSELYTLHYPSELATLYDLPQTFFIFNGHSLPKCLAAAKRVCTPSPADTSYLYIHPVLLCHFSAPILVVRHPHHLSQPLTQSHDHCPSHIAMHSTVTSNPTLLKAQ